MPSKTKLKNAAAIAAKSAALPKIPKELIDQFVTGRTFRADWCAFSQKTKTRQALATVVCSEIKRVRKPLIHYEFLRVIVSICTKSTIAPDCGSGPQ
jgi:hypothetical protein